MTYIPITIFLSQDIHIKKIESIEENPTIEDVSGCKYADLVMFEQLLHAELYSDKISILYDNDIMNIVRSKSKNPNIYLLTLYYLDQLLLITDDRREINIKEQ